MIELAHKMATRLTKEGNIDGISILSMDMQNCYNMLDRKEVLKLFHDKLPTLYPLAHSTFSKYISIISNNGKDIFNMENGWVQGMAFSSIALCLAYYALDKEIKIKYPKNCHKNILENIDIVVNKIIIIIKIQMLKWIIIVIMKINIIIMIL